LTIPVEAKVGAKASLVCWGVMPSGMLGHPLFLNRCWAHAIRPR